ncbi:hypothetical protein [Methylobacterium durans]|uniref:hypothetical protein n=1 Tax=Methylobacterium durans TaxID=2202825 RepID=UPI0013A559CB|nr:hypothetical protein [Methylobacterium durans]
MGQDYTNTSTGVRYTWNGAAWRPHDAAALTDGSIPIAALATNPLSRANHTGTQTASTISDLATVVQGYSLSAFAAPTANVSCGGFKITNLADPTNAQEAATKNYVDGAVQSAAAGIDSKPSVRLVATSNITLSGLSALDGVTPVAGDRILATAQTTTSQNGVYVAASGAWTRATDADQTGEITPGAFWFVEEGTTYGKTQWRVNNTGTITLGTTAITIVQFGAAAAYTAGSNGGLQLVGNAFSVLLPSASGLQTTASGLSILLTSTSGLTYTASGLSLLLPANSGLAQSASGLTIDTTSTIATARITSGIITGDGTTVTFTITHNLNTKRIVPAFRDSSDIGVDIDWTAATVNTMTVTFGTAPANGTTYSVAITG